LGEHHLTRSLSERLAHSFRDVGRVLRPWALSSLSCLCALTSWGYARALSVPRSGQIPQWTVFEAQFTGSQRYENPLQDIGVTVEFSSPTGKVYSVDGFWDGGNTWRVRFSPDEPGQWSYRTHASREDAAGLDSQRGNFTCVPYAGSNPLHRHGAVRVSGNRRYLEHADGTPFFWLADTAWNGALKSDLKSWDVYLADRTRKGFTTIQFVMTQWIGATGNGDARPAYLGRERIRIDPYFFQWMDAHFQALNARGMVAAPVLIWDAQRNRSAAAMNPGTGLPDDQVTRLARYMVARYGAYQVIWILAGDGDYRGSEVERWKQIGRAVFGEGPTRPVTIHPSGQLWVGSDFGNEPWFSIIGYQSGHGDSDEALKWLCQGPPAQAWKTEPVHPIINLEPNYEGHVSYERRKAFDAHAVRRAAYWSLLVSPPAGITYGGHGIWSWELSPAEPLNHAGAGLARPWFEALKMPGSTDMKFLRDLFASLKWWTLRPAPELLLEQAGEADPSRFVAAARAEEGPWALLYTPVGQEIKLRVAEIGKNLAVRWFNPRTGSWGTPEVLAGPSEVLKPPDQEDWLVWIGPRGEQPTRLVHSRARHLAKSGL